MGSHTGGGEATVIRFDTDLGLEIVKVDCALQCVAAVSSLGRTIMVLDQVPQTEVRGFCERMGRGCDRQNVNRIGRPPSQNLFPLSNR